MSLSGAVIANLRGICTTSWLSVISDTTSDVDDVSLASENVRFW
jgi:hypothetical protein